MKKKIIISTIAIIIIALAGLNIFMAQNGYRWKTSVSATSSKTIGGVEYDQAIISLGYDKIVVLIDDIKQTNSNGHEYYIITNEEGNVFRAETSNVLLTSRYVNVDTQKVQIVDGSSKR